MLDLVVEKISDISSKGFGKLFSFIDLRSAAAASARVAYVGSVFTAFVLLNDRLADYAEDLYVSLDNPWAQTAFYIVVPDNAAFCVSVYVSAHVMYAGFLWLKWATYKPIQGA